jgi:hypothetical protein
MGLYIIKGTGYSIDGTMVTIEHVGDDGFCSVTPLHGDKSTAIKIDQRCLQEVGDHPEHTYTFTVSKHDRGCIDVTGGIKLQVNSIRDVSEESLLKFIKDNMEPFLRMGG